MKPKAVIFDMDGVLIDSERFYMERRFAFFKENGISTEGLTASFFIGSNPQETFPKILNQGKDSNQIKDLIQKFDAYKSKNLVPFSTLLFPGVIPLLAYLKSKEIKIGLASSSNKEVILEMISENHLEMYFQVVLSGQEFHNSKPSPEIYLTAMEKLEVLPSQTLVIEDSPKGVESAKLAQACVWAIRDEVFGLDLKKADKIFSDLFQIGRELRLDLEGF